MVGLMVALEERLWGDKNQVVSSSWGHECAQQILWRSSHYFSRYGDNKLKI
uniref:Uncharacterized protein n=1 Tax=Anguilla anguilla TaxID=7936 RepID=A0A0E9XH08_ANGAN